MVISSEDPRRHFRESPTVRVRPKLAAARGPRRAGAGRRRITRTQHAHRESRAGGSRARRRGAYASGYCHKGGCEWCAWWWYSGDW